MKENERKRKEREKKDKNAIEAALFSTLQNCLREVVEQALDDIFKDLGF